MEKLKQKHNRREKAIVPVADCFVGSEEKEHLSSQFLLIKKDETVFIPEPYERYCNMLPLFGFNSTMFDVNMIKPYLFPVIEMIKILTWRSPRKPISGFFFNISDIKSLQIMNLHGGVTIFDVFREDDTTKDARGRVFLRLFRFFGKAVQFQVSHKEKTMKTLKLLLKMV